MSEKCQKLKSSMRSYIVATVTEVVAVDTEARWLP
jgi:hypothetical protein